MARRKLSALSADAVPRWAAPKILTLAVVRSSSLLGHDLIHRFRAERFQVFLAGLMGMWFGAGVLVPLFEYWKVRTFWFMVQVGIGLMVCAVLIPAFWLARRQRYQTSITVVCIANWIGIVLNVAVTPQVLPVLVVMALLPAVFAEPYVHWRRGLTFVGLAGVCVLVSALVARFVPLTAAAIGAPHWVETAFIVGGVTVTSVHLMVVVLFNASALRTSEAALAERAVELAASRARLASAADEERRRIERDLHDGAQQHLVSLSVLIQLARNSDRDRAELLLAEASKLVQTAITEIRQLAQGIYPALLVSGGLPDALPGLAARAAVPVHLDLVGVGRYPPSVEAGLYYCCSEALQNAAKHGGQDNSVTITGRDDGEVLRLTINDTGPGFDSRNVGMGLTNMADRLSAIGGQFDIETAVGAGTRITATVPDIGAHNKQNLAALTVSR